MMRNFLADDIEKTDDEFGKNDKEIEKDDFEMVENEFDMVEDEFEMVEDAFEMAEEFEEEFQMVEEVFEISIFSSFCSYFQSVLNHQITDKNSLITTISKFFRSVFQINSLGR